jgi:hypothetical protein
MKIFLAILAVAILCIGAIGCGSSNSDTSQNASNTPATGGTSTKTGSTPKNDRDNDGDNNDDDMHVLDFGHAANAADQRTITTLVTRYFAAAAAADGVRACSLLAPFIAESIAETYGHKPALRGKTCAVVMAKLFKLNHRELVNKNSSLKVMRVGVEGYKSLVALDFPSIPEVRQIIVRRGGKTWGILSLLDGILE